MIDKYLDMITLYLYKTYNYKNTKLSSYCS